MPTVWVPLGPTAVEVRDETEQEDSHLFPGTHMQFHEKQLYQEFTEFGTDPGASISGINIPVPPGPHPPLPPGVKPVPVKPPEIPVPVPPGPHPPAPPGFKPVPVKPPEVPVPVPPGPHPPLPPGVKPVPVKPPPGYPYPTGRTEWRPIGPRVRDAADIHMTPAAVESMKDNEEEFAKLMTTFTKGTFQVWFLLGHAVYAVGLQNSKNPDGSLDIHVSPAGAWTKGHPVHLPASTCMMIIQAA